MSSQRGNDKRSRPQKHKNLHAFKNSLHDTSWRTKEINSLEVANCCARCTEVIEWKIKYKKFKPLTVPKKCTRCSQKSVKMAYCIVCQPCCEKERVCAKCGEKKNIVTKAGLTEAEEASQKAQLEQELKSLPERQRRTFHRQQASGKLTAENDGNAEASGESTGALAGALAGASESEDEQNGDSDNCSVNPDNEEQSDVSKENDSHCKGETINFENDTNPGTV